MYNIHLTMASHCIAWHAVKQSFNVCFHNALTKILSTWALCGFERQLLNALRTVYLFSSSPFFSTSNCIEQEHFLFLILIYHIFIMYIVLILFSFPFIKFNFSGNFCHMNVRLGAQLIKKLKYRFAFLLYGTTLLKFALFLIQCNECFLSYYIYLSFCANYPIYSKAAATNSIVMPF